jgi:hypothetical protein
MVEWLGEGAVMATFKADRKHGSVDGDTNAQAILSDRRVTPLMAGMMIAQAAAPIGAAIAYGMTSHPGWLAFLILSAAWMVVGAVSTELHRHETWLLIIERRCQLIEQDADDLSTQIHEFREATKPRTCSRFD